MADTYTPTLAEIRGIYAATGFRDQTLHPGEHQSIQAWRAEFDRALATHDAQVRADALRAGAAELRASVELLDLARSADLSYINCTSLDARALEEMAARIEAQSTNHPDGSKA